MKCRKLIAATILVSLAAGAVMILSKRTPVPAVATEAQLIGFVEAQRRAILASPRLGAGGRVGPVIELPSRDRVRFLTPPREVAWWSRGGRFAPDGTLTLPNAEVPFLFPAQEDGRGRARFALLTPPMRESAPVPNTVDLPPVALTRGKDRTVWTGTLPKDGDRYPYRRALEFGVSRSPTTASLRPGSGFPRRLTSDVGSFHPTGSCSGGAFSDRHDRDDGGRGHRRSREDGSHPRSGVFRSLGGSALRQRFPPGRVVHPYRRS